MELKLWSEYTQEEKERVLEEWLNSHWFFVHPSEAQEYKRLLEMNIDLMFDAAFVIYMDRKDSRFLLTAMRSGRTAELLNFILIERNREGYKRLFENFSPKFLKTIIDRTTEPSNEAEKHTNQGEIESSNTDFHI